MALQNIQVRQGTRYNRLAIASLGLAAMALLGHVLMSVAVLAVFAVGAGHVSLAQIKRRRERGRGLAVAALAIGYAIAAMALFSTVYFAATLAIQQGP